MFLDPSGLCAYPAIPSVLCKTRLVSVGNLEVAVSLLLSTPPESSYFYVNALRAVALSSAVSMSLHELAVKVSLVRTCSHFEIKLQVPVVYNTTVLFIS